MLRSIFKTKRILFPGDIITQINGRPIYTSKDLLEVRNTSKKGDTWDMFFVRNGQLYRVQLKYDLYYSNNS
jgi:S1-C subfamily serine protease